MIFADLANGFSSIVSSGRTTFQKRALPCRSLVALSLVDSPQKLEVEVEKPLGIVLEENEEDEAKGVYCLECSEDSAAFAAGVRQGDVITSLAGTDTTELTFEQVMDMMGKADSPVGMSLERVDVIVETKTTKAPVKMAPKRMPSAKQLAKASTNVNFWKDPLMIGSAAFTVILPLGIYLASKQ